MKKNIKITPILYGFCFIIFMIFWKYFLKGIFIFDTYPIYIKKIDLFIIWSLAIIFFIKRNTLKLSNKDLYLVIFIVIFTFLSFPLAIFYDEVFIYLFYFLLPISFIELLYYYRSKKNKKVFIITFIISLTIFLFINLSLKFWIYDRIIEVNKYLRGSILFISFVLGFIYLIRRIYLDEKIIKRIHKIK